MSFGSLPTVSSVCQLWPTSPLVFEQMWVDRPHSTCLRRLIQYPFVTLCRFSFSRIMCSVLHPRAAHDPVPTESHFYSEQCDNVRSFRLGDHRDSYTRKWQKNNQRNQNKFETNVINTWISIKCSNNCKLSLENDVKRTSFVLSWGTLTPTPRMYPII